MRPVLRKSTTVLAVTGVAAGYVILGKDRRREGNSSRLHQTSTTSTTSTASKPPFHSPSSSSSTSSSTSSSSSAAANRMAPGLLQTPDTAPSSQDQPQPQQQRSNGDALESMKAGIAGHAAALSGLSRSGGVASLSPSLSGIPAFETTYAVPMHCESCVQGVEGVVGELSGIESAKADLSTGLLHVKGTAAPSAIVGTLQESGRDAILRGSGAAGSSAAVCILELVDGAAATEQGSGYSKSPVRGLARLVQVSESHTLVDLTLSGLRPGRYEARIRATGDISRGLSSLGGVWQGTEGTEGLDATGGSVKVKAKGDLGTIEVDAQGRGAAYIAQEMKVWEIIGRGMSVMRKGEGAVIEAGAGEGKGEGKGERASKGEGVGESEGEGVCGVLARSAGVWDNDKVVCSCSGKTVWEERQDQRARGVL